MKTVSLVALADCPAQAGFDLPFGLTAKRSTRLDFVVVTALSLFAFILPTDLRTPTGTSIAMRLGYASLLLGSIGVIKRRSTVLNLPGLWCLLGFLLWSSCTFAWAEYPAAAQHKILTYWALFLVAAIIPQYAWEPRVRERLIDSYVAGCWLGVIGLAVNFAAGVAYAAEGADEMEGRYSFSTDPNYLALALVIGVPLVLFRSTTVKATWQKAVCWLYVPAAVVGVVLTGSRGALLALAAAVVAYALLAGAKARVLLGAGALLCLLVAGLLPSQVSERFASIPEELRHGTLSDRRDLWVRGTRVAEDHPVEGIGAGATAGLFDVAAHNTPLELTMEGGAISVGLFYGAFLLGIGRAYKSDPREANAMIAASAAWLVGTLSLSWEVDTVTWFILAILFSAGSSRSAGVAMMRSPQSLERPA